MVKNRLTCMIKIKKDDLLSDDSKFVYLNRNTTNGLSERMQSVQTLENYLSYHDVVDFVFNLNYKSVIKASGIGGIGTTVLNNHQHVVYFNNELIFFQ